MIVLVEGLFSSWSTLYVIPSRNEQLGFYAAFGSPKGNVFKVRGSYLGFKFDPKTSTASYFSGGTIDSITDVGRKPVSKDLYSLYLHGLDKLSKGPKVTDQVQFGGKTLKVTFHLEWEGFTPSYNMMYKWLRKTFYKPFEEVKQFYLGNRS